VVDKLRNLRTQLDKGATPKAGYAYYTVRQAALDWLAHGLDGRSLKTVTKNQNVLQRAIRHAEASDLVTRNVATLADTPKAGKAGRPGP
jgi:hypothetical protein